MVANAAASTNEDLDFDMRASRDRWNRRRRQDAIAGPPGLPLAALWKLACVAVTTLLALACIGPAPQAPVPPDTTPPAPGALRVRLVFGAEADLDLYVSGPLLETVYFANETSRDGGALEADRRCEDTSPRVETVVFENAPAGPYRVGVDFMIRCERGTDEAPYTLVVEAPGQPPRTHHGAARFGAFEPVALEFTIAPTAAR